MILVVRVNNKILFGWQIRNMALAYSDLPIVGGATKCYATYQNLLRSAIDERNNLVGGGVVLPPTIVAGDPIKTTYQQWLKDARVAIEDILTKKKYGYFYTDPFSLAVSFKTLDKNELLRRIHTNNVNFGADKFINDVYVVTPHYPIAGVEALFCSENSAYDFMGGDVGSIRAFGSDYIAFTPYGTTQEGPPIKTVKDGYYNIFDDPVSLMEDNDVLNTGIVEAGNAAVTKTGPTATYYELRPTKTDPIDIEMGFKIPIADIAKPFAYMNVIGRYEIDDIATAKEITIYMWNYDTNIWDFVNVIKAKLKNADPTKNVDVLYQMGIVSAHHVKPITGDIKIRMLSSNIDPTDIVSHLYLNFVSLCYTTVAGSKKFVRVTRTTDAPISGTGNVLAALATDRAWMYYDKGVLDPLYQGYDNEIFYALEYLRYTEFDLGTPTINSVDWKSGDGVGVDINSGLSQVNAINNFIGHVYAAAANNPPAYCSVHSYLSAFVPVTYTTHMEHYRIHSVTIPDPGPNINRLYIPMVFDYALALFAAANIYPQADFLGTPLPAVGVYDYSVGRKRWWAQYGPPSGALTLSILTSDPVADPLNWPIPLIPPGIDATAIIRLYLDADPGWVTKAVVDNKFTYIEGYFSDPTL